MSVRVVVQCVAVLLVAAQVATAAPKPSDDLATAEARKHVEAAKVHYKLGEFAEAIVAFKEAYRLKPVPGLLFNLAQAHRMAGNLKDSRFLYQTYLRDLPNAPNRLEVERQLEQLAAAIAEEDAKSPPPEGKPEPGPEPRMEPEPGPAPEPVVVATEPAAAAAPAPTVEPAAFDATSFVLPEEPTSRVLPLSLGVASAVLAVAGAVTYGLARADWSDAAGQERPRPEVDAVIAAGDTKRTVSMGLGVAAVAAGAGAAVFYFAF